MLSVVLNAAKITFIAMFAAVLFGLTKYRIHPNFSFLGSLIAWVVFFTLSAFIVSVVMLRREKATRANLLKDIDRRRKLEQHLRLQRSALDAAANAVVITDRDGVVVWVNRAFNHLTGYESSEVVGQSTSILKSGRHDAQFYSNLWQTIHAGGVWRGEIVNRRKDGQLYVEEMTITPVRSEQNEITHFIAIKVDITQRKKIEESLLNSESILRSIVQNAPYGIFRSTEDGTILSANHSLWGMLGYDSETDLLCVKTSAVYSNPADRQTIVDRLLTESYVSEFETRWRRKDGVEITVRLSGHKIQSDREAGTLLFEGYVEDITERKQAKSELLRLNRAHSTLSKCNEALVHATDESHLLDKICESIVNVGGYRLAWVGYSQEDKVVKPIAKAGLDDGYIENAQVTWDDTAHGCGPIGTAIRERRVTVVRSVENDSQFAPWRDEALRRGFASVISLPLSDKSRIFGALTIYASESDAFDFREVELIKELADDLAYGILALRGSEERKRAENALRGSEERYRTLYDHSLAAVFHSSDGKLLDCNEAMCQMLGYTREEIKALDLRNLYKDPSTRDAGQKLLREYGRLTNHEVELCRKDGAVIRVLANLNLVSHEPDQAPVVTGVMLDITEVRKLQEQLLQSQKMEAIGKLTGGIAHDFNNMLMIILSYSELILNTLDKESPFYRQVEQIRIAADRATSLTRQLLAFSRKQLMTPVPLKLDATVISFKQLLKRLIGEDVELEIISDPNVWTIRADVSQIEQVLLNLVVNARDAMPNGGKILIRASNVELGEGFVAANPGSRPGQYVALTVADTGCGISPEIQSRIFEPFFTTKEVGYGTGLGLSTVYGIVKQSGGYVTLESEIAKGTTFYVYLPRTPDPVTEQETARSELAAIPNATILVVEDEDPTREAISNFLEQKGFRVISASKSDVALQKCKIDGRVIDVLLTDVVMPGMNGVDLAKAFRSIFPDAVVIFMSGYTDDVLLRSGLAQPQTMLLAKPFGLPALVEKLRSVLK